VRLRQKRFTEAIAIYQAARDTFAALGEPQQVAAVWHQIGRVHQEAGHLDEAEAAYQKSLAMKVQAGNKPGEASSRLQLGNLYNRMPGRREEAVLFFRQAAEIYADPATANPLNEGVARSNAANTLVALGRFDEARAELTRALECKRGLGPNAEPWKTWGILHDLETAVGNAAAAADARRQARADYLAARRQGWEITRGPAAKLCQHVALIVIARHPQTPPDQIPGELRSQIPQLERALRQQLAGWDESVESDKKKAGGTPVPRYLSALAPKLLAILDGSRDPALADDPALDYDDAAELQLLLEQLSSTE
jgi:tetratricopeptide (TPR) repeat protein